MSQINVTDDDVEEPKPIKIDFDVTFDLKCQASLSCPIMDENLKLDHSLTSRVELFSGCQNKTCQCDLDLKFSVDKTEIVVGKDKELKLTYDIPNDGHEPGYGATLVLISNIGLKKTPKR